MKAYEPTVSERYGSGMDPATGPEKSFGDKFKEFSDSRWGKAAKSLLTSQGGGEDSGTPDIGGGGGPTSSFPIGEQPERYTSGHVTAQQQFADDLMKQYMASGGGYYG